MQAASDGKSLRQIAALRWVDMPRSVSVALRIFHWINGTRRVSRLTNDAEKTD